MKRKREKAQSAMEYLMTYGWAILIIAVVLGVLFQLGIFNSTNFAPRAPPGSCKIFRSAAGGSPNLVGVCSGQLPQYTSLFNGQNSYANLNSQILQEAGTNSISFSVWFKTISLPSSWPMVFSDTAGTPRNGYDLYVGGAGSSIPNQLSLERFYGGTDTSTYTQNTLSLNTWYFAVGTYDGSTLRLYLNGTLVGTPNGSPGSISLNNVIYMGSSAWGNFGNFQISNFEVYNTVLQPSDIQSLYIRGIGAAPLNLQNLMGWWPLNGDANDYSGNNNNGAPTNVVYTNQWLPGYMTP